MSEIRVKPLMWEGGPYSWQADTVFSDDMDEWSVYVVEQDGDTGNWGMWPPGCNDDPASWHGSDEKAFVAAQADYTARILSALVTPAPQPHNAPARYPDTPEAQRPSSGPLARSVKVTP